MKNQNRQRHIQLTNSEMFMLPWKYSYELSPLPKVNELRLLKIENSELTLFQMPHSDWFFCVPQGIES